jgi:hypothetical protein
VNALKPKLTSLPVRKMFEICNIDCKPGTLCSVGGWMLTTEHSVVDSYRAYKIIYCKTLFPQRRIRVLRTTGSTQRTCTGSTTTCPQPIVPLTSNCNVTTTTNDSGLILYKSIYYARKTTQTGLANYHENEASYKSSVD